MNDTTQIQECSSIYILVDMCLSEFGCFLFVCYVIADFLTLPLPRTGMIDYFDCLL